MGHPFSVDYNMIIDQMESKIKESKFKYDIEPMIINKYRKCEQNKAKAEIIYNAVYYNEIIKQ